MSATNVESALTGFVPQVIPELILGVMACVLFLGATFRCNRHIWGIVALLSLALAACGLAYTLATIPTVESQLLEQNTLPAAQQLEKQAEVNARIYAAPILFTQLAIFFKILALVSGVLLVLFGWNEGGDSYAGEYHACLLLITAGISLVGSANELITLFLALELISIPTYILLYLPRADARAQEAALKYFLLSVFASGLLLFGFSYLYGIAGTTNIPAILEAISADRVDPVPGVPANLTLAWMGVSLVALVMVVAGLGFRITAVPFHFYAPDVYEGTTTASANLLAFIPKIVGFAALIKILGFVAIGSTTGIALKSQVPMLLWIMAAFTMTLGNILALLQDNLRRMLAYSSVAHAGYMLIGLAVVPQIGSETMGGIEAILFYLLAYGAMTVGVFAVLECLSSSGRSVETVDDLAGLSRTHPNMALLMALFLFSLIGIPATAGFFAKGFLFLVALNVLTTGDQTGWLFGLLAFIAAINAAIGAWYYLRLATAMYLREAIEPLPRIKPSPVLGAIAVCAVTTIVLGLYPAIITGTLRQVVAHEQIRAVALPMPERHLAER